MSGLSIADGVVSGGEAGGGMQWIMVPTSILKFQGVINNSKSNWNAAETSKISVSCQLDF
jgi:hypothetical protein